MKKKNVTKFILKAFFLVLNQVLNIMRNVRREFSIPSLLKTVWIFKGTSFTVSEPLLLASLLLLDQSPSCQLQSLSELGEGSLPLWIVPRRQPPPSQQLHSSWNDSFSSNFTLLTVTLPITREEGQERKRALLSLISQRGLTSKITSV